MANEGPWHLLSVEEVAARLEVRPEEGLEAAVAADRLARVGPNRLAETPPRPAWRRFADQFKSLLILVLIGAAGIAWAIGDVRDAVVILVVVLFNASFSFYQEHRAERTLAALKGMLAPHTRVRRDGRSADIDAADVVPGDILLVEAGDQLAADGRIVQAHNVEVEEAALTGESMPVAKHPEPLDDPEAPLGERTNMAFMNTVITRGRAEVLVTATGMDTEMGRLARLLDQTPAQPTPLQRRLDVLGKRLALIAGVVVLLIFALTIARGSPWSEAAMTAVALAVAAIPEGLPAVVTVTLAVGMWRMAKNRAVLKQLAAVETLGSTTVICSDKTGTLTLNQMTARAGWTAGETFDVTGRGYELEGGVEGADGTDLRPLLLPLALCNESRVTDGRLIGDPTEGALWVLAHKGGLPPDEAATNHPRLAEIPFDSDHKFMATFHPADEGVLMLVKGAPAVLLERSARWLGPEGEVDLDAERRQRIEAAEGALADRALRVLAVAQRRVDASAFDAEGDLWAYADDWTFVGLVGLMDPPRPEAATAISACVEAGIAVKMITGDHRLTAGAVARELGLRGEVVSGADLDALSDEALADRIDDIGVFARVAPLHKVRIVRALKDRGHVVAMTGDGVNDAPALRTADIGVAMGITGTAVTREAATLVLTDDNFATIVRAVEEGRIIYDNLVKFVRFQLATNVGAILTVLTATLVALPTPFTAIQLLWINIIMDGPPAMTLGLDPARPGLMQDSPRPPDEEILSRQRLGVLLFHGALMMVGTLTVSGLAGAGPAHALTLGFTTFVLFQMVNVFNVRVERRSALGAHSLRNLKLHAALVGVIALQVAAVHWPPAQAIFGTVALSATDWLLAAGVASTVLWLDEARKGLGLLVPSQPG